MYVRDRVARFFLAQHTKIGKNIPNDHNMYHKIYQMAVDIPNGNNSIPRPSQIYPNFDFWYENIPSGITGKGSLQAKKCSF
jgi:hypothetical protein